VKILFDANTPTPLALLDAAETAGFDLLLTCVDFVQTGQIVRVDVAAL